MIDQIPTDLIRLNVSSYRNYKASSVSDIPSFSGTVTLTSVGLSKFKDKVYEFNQQNVQSSYDYYLIRVKYIGEDKDYVYVVKNFKSSGGGLIESIGSYSGIELFSSGCNVENQSNVIYCTNIGSNFNLKYVSNADRIYFTPSFVIPRSAYDGLEEEVLYNFECESGNCDYGYCGDKVCYVDDVLGVNEKDPNNSNYCPQDCGRNVPLVWYIILGVVLLLGIFWINFYRGPGNFFEVTNVVSYKLFKKRLFLVEKDRLVLTNYIIKALREGFNEGEIRKALYKKGWSEKQLNYVFKSMRKK
jgi:hypothetical protein